MAISIFQDRHPPRSTLPRHRHGIGYAAVVLSGEFLEAGMGRRIKASPGTVILHPALSGHQDWFGDARVEILNLPLELRGPERSGTIKDVDRLARTAERDLSEAAALLKSEFAVLDRPALDWPDILAGDLMVDKDLSITQWARDQLLDPASVSRGFRMAYGVSPKRFRLESKVAHALELLQLPNRRAAQVAAESGFADQPHMCRAFRAIFGRAPSQLMQTSFNQT